MRDTVGHLSTVFGLILLRRSAYGQCSAFSSSRTWDDVSESRYGMFQSIREVSTRSFILASFCSHLDGFVARPKRKATEQFVMINCEPDVKAIFAVLAPH